MNPTMPVKPQQRSAADLLPPGTRLILASASPRRRELLAGLGLPCEQIPCPLPEPATRPPAVAARPWAEAVAYFKARVVAERYPAALVLGADTIVVCAGQLLGKPRDRADAERMLRLQAGVASEVITGVALVRLAAPSVRLLDSAVTRVWMRDDPAERQRYLDSGEWTGKAGAYGIQDVGDRLIERIEGSFSNVVGLPVELLGDCLRGLAPA
jgi:septum formation protein